MKDCASSLRGMATSQEIKEYINSVIEQDFEDSNIEQEDSNKKQILQKNLLGNISADIALFFNKLIFCINQAKKNTLTYSYQRTNDKKPSLGVQSSAFCDQSKEDEQVSSTRNRKGEKKSIQEGKNQIDIDKLKAKQMQLGAKFKDEPPSDITPKKPVSSFFLFYQERSKDLAAQTGEVVGAKIAQLVAESWKNLNAEQKRPYYQKAIADKERYRQQMGKYIQTHSAEVQQIKRLKRIRNKRVKEENKRRQKDQGEQKVENPSEDQLINMKIKAISQRQMKAADRKAYSHRPKAPVSSFFLFYQEEARNIASQYGQTVGSRLARLASSIWKKMSPQSKEKYQKVAQVERQRYHQEMIQYKIDYPEEVQNRRKKISNNMKRSLRQLHQKQPQQNDSDDKSQKDSNQDMNLSNSLGNISDLSSDSSQIDNKQLESISKVRKQDKKSVSSNSYVSSDQSDNQQERQNGKHITKDQQDLTPHKPRAPIGSFFQYYNANLHIFHQRASMSQKQTDPFQLASQIWKTLSLEQKKPYFQMANRDILRYQRQIQDFRQKYPSQYLIYHSQNSKLKVFDDSIDE